MRHTTFNIMLLLVFLLFICRFEYCYSNNAGCLEGERISLLQFKESLVHRSIRLSSWTGLDCCKWEGVFCSSTTGHVLKLDLRNPATYDDDDDWSWESGLPSNYSNNCLGGEINHSLINLTRLDYLDLSLNNFSGIQIPEFLGSFKNLKYLNLSSSGFVGNIPTHLGNLSSLEYLHLGVAPEGPLPIDYLSNDHLTTDNLDWLSRLSSLKSLDMSWISIRHSEDWLYAINKLVSLSSLNLANCGLNTTNPLSHVNSTSLISLILQGNSLDFTIFPCLSNLTRIEHLNLAENYILSGNPNIFEHLAASLKVLDLSLNYFISSPLIPLCKFHNLVYMDLSFNALQGVIPHCLGNMTSLSFLNLAANSFEGSIPNSMSRLCKLKVLYFSVNKLSGMLTDFIGVPSDCLFSLQELQLDYNNFIGQLPNQLYKYKNLELLSLSTNSFFGPVSRSLQNLSKLQWLDISNNKFSGNIFSSLQDLLNLEVLRISNNFFTDVLVESHFSKLSNLRELSISTNLFVSNISSHWIPPFQLRTIEMDSIKIGPHFPKWLQTQSNVDFLSMSNASIYSTIPEWFWKLQWSARLIDFSQNHISGELLMNDLEIAMNHKWSTLSLILSKNHLSGGIPMGLCSFKEHLYVLDLFANNLSGEIPSCFGELQGLEVLDLANNNLNGCIPNSLGSLQWLHSLHLQSNKLNGKLPSSLQNLKSLRFLDLGENELMDVIPTWIGGKLSNMRFLRFKANKFYGNIPSQLCQLSVLQLLDLAQNNLSGHIPMCFDNLTGMIFDGSINLGLDPQYDKVYEITKGLVLEYSKNLRFYRSLDLSNNHIIGKIPVGVTSLRALENLNLSGNNLSGLIPETIGNLKNIESLDLSRNILSGHIPPSLSSLTSLSHLNLSFNNLSGRIPTGSQLQTFNNPSIYLGNEGLCGTPLLKGCLDDKVSFVDQPKVEIVETNDDHEFFLWFCAGIGPGFFVGFIGVLCILLFKRSWCYAYFKFLEIAYNKIILFCNRFSRW